MPNIPEKPTFAEGGEQYSVTVEEYNALIDVINDTARLPQGAQALATVSGVVAFDDTAGLDLDGTMPAGSTPVYFIVHTRTAKGGAPENLYLNIGTPAAETFFFDDETFDYGLGNGALNIAYFVPNGDQVTNFFEPLAAETTVRVTPVSVVGGGSAATAGAWTVVFFFLLPTS